MAKINSKIDKELRKEVIENGVFLGIVLIFGFNDNIYLYENEVYVEQFKLIDDDYVITDFYQGSWEVINTNIYNGKFIANEHYAEALIDFMSLYNRSLYLGKKKYREIAKEQFAELKKDYQESELLDDINALLKKSKSKTFRYSTVESLKESENFVNYIAVYDEDGDCKGYVQNESPKLTQNIEKALHFKNENEANNFISKLIKRGTFSSDDLYVEGMYLNESKKSVKKSLKESKIDKGRVTYEFICLLNRLGLNGVDYSNDENDEKCDEIIDMIVDLAKTMPRL